MNSPKARFAGLAAVVVLLAGCAAEYRNESACVHEMRRRLADQSQQSELSVTNRAVAWRGSRVVIEGQIRGFDVAAAAAAASASAASAASAVKAASNADAPVVVKKAAASQRTAAAAQCTFEDSTLKSFHWLTPAALAATTPEPADAPSH